MILVYKYGLLAPTERADVVREQMSCAHRYRNTLIEIERGRRAAVREAERVYSDLGSLQAVLASAAETSVTFARSVKEERSKTRGKSDASALRLALAEARRDEKVARAALFARRKERRADPVLALRLDEIQDRAGVLRRSAREYCKCYWGTYLLIEDACEAAFKSTPLYDFRGEANDPPFVGWNRVLAHRVGVQIQAQSGEAPFTPRDLAGGEDTRIYIADPSPGARETRRSGQRTALRMRVASDWRAPVWAEWPMTMHRPLPPGCRIKRAVVSLRPSRLRDEWSVEITIDAALESLRIVSPTRGAVALDLGWRSFRSSVDGGRVRIGLWRDETGESGEIAVDSSTWSGLEKAESLRSIRDRNFDAARAALIAWIDTREVPEWLSLSVGWLARTRSHERVASLVRLWRSERFSGDAAGYEAAEAWRRQNRHLDWWESSQRDKSLGRRKDEYRQIAARLADCYAALVIESFNISDVAQRPKIEGPSEGEQKTRARSNRQMAAPSELRLAVVSAFRRRGRDIIEVPSAYSTVTCGECGARIEEDPALKVSITCSSCGSALDQDENAAQNLMAAMLVSARELPDSASDPGVGTETRWQKARRIRREKDSSRRSLQEQLGALETET